MAPVHCQIFNDGGEQTMENRDYLLEGENVNLGINLVGNKEIDLRVEKMNKEVSRGKYMQKGGMKNVNSILNLMIQYYI